MERIELDRRVTIRESREVVEQLERLAVASGRSVSDEIRAAVREHLPREEQRA